jgi:hypothetical protein
MWRANTDTPKKQTRQITEESFDMVRMFYEIRGVQSGKRQNRIPADSSEIKQ